MTEEQIKKQVIEVVDNLDIFEKFRLWNEYSFKTISRNYEFKVTDFLIRTDYHLVRKYYKNLILYVGTYPKEWEKYRPMSFEEFISEQGKKKESYSTGNFYNLSGIYHHFKNKLWKRKNI